jgi:hypothetical protein
VAAQESQQVPAQELELVPAQQLEPVLVQVSPLVPESEPVLHLLHRQPQSLCQLQRSHPQQHEFLSILPQLVTVLQYRLCL